MRIRPVYSIYDAAQHGKRIKVYFTKWRAERLLEQSIYYYMKISTATTA